MPPFPDDMDFKLVEDVYVHYRLAIFDSVQVLYVYCEWCDDVVCQFDFETVKGLGEEELYALILSEHNTIE